MYVQIGNQQEKNRLSGNIVSQEKTTQSSLPERKKNASFLTLSTQEKWLHVTVYSVNMCVCLWFLFSFYLHKRVLLLLTRTHEKTRLK